MNITTFLAQAEGSAIASNSKDWLANIWTMLIEKGLPILAAIGLLILGYIVAKIITGIVGKLLRKTDIDNKIASGLGASGISIESILSTIVFWVIMLFVAVAVFSRLGIPEVTEPLNGLLSKITGYLPQLGGALALLGVAWLIATIVKKVLITLFEKSQLDNRLNSYTASEDTDVEDEDGMVETTKPAPVSKSIAEVAYWLIFLLFLPPILGTLQLGGILEPVNAMVGKITGFLPNLLGAAVIVAIGYFVGRLLQRIVSNFLSAAGADRLGDKMGLKANEGGKKLSDIAGLVLFSIVILGALLAGIDTLGVQSLTDPAKNMLNGVMEAVPLVLTGAVIVTISYFLGKVVSSIVENLLTGLGFDGILSRLGFANASTGSSTPSKIVGKLIFVAFVFLGTTQALETSGLTGLATATKAMLAGLSKVLIGVVVFGIGLYLANFASRIVASSGQKHSDLLATLTKAGVIIVAAFIALDVSNIGSAIVPDAFKALAYGLAIAVGIAFGWGGREHASKLISKIETSLSAPKSEASTSKGKA